MSVSYTHLVLSYGISKTPSAASVLSAQKQAIEITSDCPYRRTFHSDRGWAYQMGAYSSVLKENKIFQSMSRKGNCYDNSVMENFFGILKQEMYYGTTYYSFEELKDAIERYIKYYNEKRIKEKLGWMLSLIHIFKFIGHIVPKISPNTLTDRISSCDSPIIHTVLYIFNRCF